MFPWLWYDYQMSLCLPFKKPESGLIPESEIANIYLCLSCDGGCAQFFVH